MIGWCVCEASPEKQNGSHLPQFASSCTLTFVAVFKFIVFSSVFFDPDVWLLFLTTSDAFFPSVTKIFGLTGGLWAFRWVQCPVVCVAALQSCCTTDVVLPQEGLFTFQYPLFLLFSLLFPLGIWSLSFGSPSKSCPAPLSKISEFLFSRVLPRRNTAQDLEGGRRKLCVCGDSYMR